MNSMRILVCTSEYPPNYSSGIGNVACNVVEQLKKLGVECTVCSPNGDIKLGSSRMIEKSGILGLLYYWHQVSNYFKEKNDDYDVVWLHNPLFLKKSPFQRSVVAMHTTYYGKAIQGLNPKIYNKIVSKIERHCLSKINEKARFTAVSPQVCKELEEIGISKERITYIPNGVDTELFKPSDNKKLLRKKFGIPEIGIIILSLGRLTEAKQPQKLIDVFSVIEKEMKDVTLVIAGKGGLSEKTKEIVRQKRLKNVRFLGYVDEKDKPDLYARSDYYIITSKYEGQPLTLLEAMASGLPCIASDIPNLRIVEDAKCGLIVDFEDIGKAAKKIIGYLERDNSEHSKNAREYAVKNLDWKIIAEMYWEEFEKVLSKGGYKKMPTDHLNVCMIANADLSKSAGDTGRIMAFASELKKKGVEVTLVVPKHRKNELMIPSHGVNLVYLPIKQMGGSIISVFRRTYSQVKKAKELQKENPVFLVETSSLGGYFAIAGFSGYVLDVHGISFDEVSFACLPWYIPRNIYRRYMYFLEKVAVKRAAKVIAVSEAMAKFIANEWKVPEDNIVIIPNGYFTSPVANIVEKRVKEKKGMVTFVGLLAKWADVDKIIRAANILKNEEATFYIVGDDPYNYRQELEELVCSYGLTNVVFTGSVPLEKAYEMIARSEVVLSPLENTLSKVVCCPIKVLEYMAFGKAMVLDEVSDLSKYLKEKDAALLCDPDNEEEFAENIRLLLKNSELRKRIGDNAKRLAEDFTWEKQGQKLAKVFIDYRKSLVQRSNRQ